MIKITNSSAYNSERYRGMEIGLFKKELIGYFVPDKAVDVGFPFCGAKVEVKKEDKEKILSTLDELEKLLKGEIIGGWKYVSKLDGVPFSVFDVGAAATHNADRIEYALPNVKAFVKDNFIAEATGKNDWRAKYSHFVDGAMLIAEEILAEKGKPWGEF